MGTYFVFTELSGNDPDGIGLDIFNPQNAEVSIDNVHHA